MYHVNDRTAGVFGMPSMKARFIVTASLALTTGTAAASDWQPVGSNEDVSFTMDVASFVRQGQVVRAWLRSVYAEPVDDGDGRKVSASLSRNYFDCINRRWAIKQTTFFTDKNFKKVAHVGREESDALLDWSEVPPDTAAEVLLEFACSYVPQK
jgi:hypothetical protein